MLPAVTATVAAAAGWARLLLQTTTYRRYSGGGAHDEYYQLQRIHESLKDVEDLFAKYRMDRFTETKQVDDLLGKGIISEHMARELRKEIGVRQEASSTHQM